jgi:cell wall-associated NlpC family hydrolase
MTETRPKVQRSRPVGPLLSRAKALRTVDERVNAHSRILLGSPYAVNPLGGSPDGPEVFSSSLGAFDCVTYVETVLALALSKKAHDFPEWLRRIRYDGGRVAWTRRNHYMTGWIRSNLRLGVVRRIGPGIRTVSRERTLGVVPGLSPRKVLVRCVPKAEMRRLEPRLRTGDLAFFASARKRLDVFHCGIVVRSGAGWRLRHAARSGNAVVEQDLFDFLRANRMAGVIVVRPSVPMAGLR